VVSADRLLELFLSANQLKRVARTGWVMRGVADAESVSDHSYSVAFIALTLADFVEEDLDIRKLVTLALLHDLPEGILSDIPSPAAVHLPDDAKEKAEVSALKALLEGLPRAEEWCAWWQETEEQATTEGRLVHDADRLDLLLQAFVYEQTTGNRWLDEFWRETTVDTFDLEVSRRVFEALCETRRKRVEGA
jgi:putative hydrolase of HD superfamily